MVYLSFSLPRSLSDASMDLIECRPRSPHWHCGRARETLPAEIRRARNGVKVQRANARSTLGFCWLRAAQCAHRRSHWFVYWVVGDSEVGSHLPRMTLALSPNVYLPLMRTLFPPSMPDSERKTLALYRKRAGGIEPGASGNPDRRAFDTAV